MTGNPYRDHMAERVFGADPVELIVVLYEELVRSIGEARRHLAGGRPLERARAVTRAMEIVGELARAVDAGADAGLAGRLCELYGFMLERLQAGHGQQLDRPFEEAERVALTLLEGWRGIRAQQVHGALGQAPVKAPAVSLAG